MDAGLEIVLEFARAENTGDAHAFRFTAQAYIARTPRGGFERAELAWDAGLLADLQAVRLPGRDPAVQQRVGEVLRRFLAATGWEQHELAIADAVQRRRPVQVTLRSAAAELYALPWELLALRTTGQALGGLPGVLVRYEWPETATAAIEPASGRVLVAWSAAAGGVPASEHVLAIQRAAGERGMFDATGDVLAHASSGRLAAALAAAEAAGRPVTVLHLLCHGAAQGQVFGLALHGEAADDDAVVVDPGRLAQILAPYLGSLRLVVLAACDSGNAGAPGNRMGSLAQMLHRAGLATVVASRFPLSVGGSVRLCEALYAAILKGRSIEAGFVAARTALAGDAASLDWASVQLYARAADGGDTRLFAGPPVVAEPPVQPAPVQAPVQAPTPTRRRTWALAAAAAVGVVIGAWSLRHVLEGEPASGATGGAVTTHVEPGAGGAGPTREPATDAGATKEPATDAGATKESATGAGEASATGAGATKESATGATHEPATSAGDEPKKPVKKPPVTPSTGTSTVDCPPAVQSYIRGVLPSTGARAVPVVVIASKKGGLSVTAGDAAAESEARAKLGQARAERVVADAKGALPCRYNYEWSR